MSMSLCAGDAAKISDPDSPYIALPVPVNWITAETEAP